MALGISSRQLAAEIARRIQDPDIRERILTVIIGRLTSLVNLFSTFGERPSRFNTRDRVVQQLIEQALRNRGGVGGRSVGAAAVTGQQAGGVTGAVREFIARQYAQQQVESLTIPLKATLERACPVKTGRALRSIDTGASRFIPPIAPVVVTMPFTFIGTIAYSWMGVKYARFVVRHIPRLFRRYLPNWFRGLSNRWWTRASQVVAFGYFRMRASYDAISFTRAARIAQRLRPFTIRFVIEGERGNAS